MLRKLIGFIYHGEEDEVTFSLERENGFFFGGEEFVVQCNVLGPMLHSTPSDVVQCIHQRPFAWNAAGGDEPQPSPPSVGLNGTPLLQGPTSPPLIPLVTETIKTPGNREHRSRSVKRGAPTLRNVKAALVGGVADDEVMGQARRGFCFFVRGDGRRHGVARGVNIVLLLFIVVGICFSRSFIIISYKLQEVTK